ncbi:MAG: HAD family hydrolase [Chloroflexota bacterium]
MIKALVFDFDGLILDTETPDYASWREIYEEYGGELTLEEWSVCIGKAEVDFDPYAILEGQIGRSIERSAIRQKRRARYLEMVEAQEPLPGVLRYLEDAHKAGFKIGMATSSTEGWAWSHLQRLQLEHYFEVIHTAGDVAQAKPHPALYRMTVEALGVPPQRALALEDSRNGMLSAKAAGLHCVVVPNGMTKGLDFTEADRQLNSLADITLADLCRQLTDTRHWS